MNWLEHYSNAANALSKGDITKAHSEYALGLKASQSLTGTERQAAVDTLNSFRKLLDAATANQATPKSKTSTEKQTQQAAPKAPSSAAPTGQADLPPVESNSNTFVASAIPFLFLACLAVIPICHDPLQPWVMDQAQQALDNKDDGAADRWLWLAGDEFHMDVDRDRARLMKAQVLIAQGKSDDAQEMVNKARKDTLIMIQAKCDAVQELINQARGGISIPKPIGSLASTRALSSSPAQAPPYTPPSQQSLSVQDISGNSPISDRYQTVLRAGSSDNQVYTIRADMEVQAWYGKGFLRGPVSISERANLCLAIALVDLALAQMTISEKTPDTQYFAEPLKYNRSELNFQHALAAMTWAKRLGTQSSDLQWLEATAQSLAQRNTDLPKYLRLYQEGRIVDMTPHGTAVDRALNKYGINTLNGELGSELPVLFRQAQSQGQTSNASPDAFLNDGKVHGLPHLGSPAGMALHPKSTMEEQSEAATPASPYPENPSPQ